MNRLDRAKVNALRACRMGFGTWDAAFVNSLAAQVQVDPALALSDRQRFLLDVLVYRYRRQLAGNVPFELPASEPKESDYVRSPPAQAVLFQ
jgi:hypothetical protein